MFDAVFLLTLGFSLLVVLLLVLIAVKSLKRSSEDADEDGSSEIVRPRGRPVPRTAGGVRHRARPQLTRGVEDDENDEEGPMDEANFDQFDDGDFQDDGSKGKIGVKKQRKLEMKAEKKMARERELQEREERKQRLEEVEKQRKLEEERIEADEKAKAETERVEKEEKARKEQAEYEKMKEMFSIEDAGYDGDVTEEESQNKLQAFIEYIKNQKVVHMDELAGHFNLKTQDVVQRLQDLLAQELLVGVIDDRGKFIYITNEELQAVAKFMRQRGRVSITDLAENSNIFINLNPVESKS